MKYFDWQIGPALEKIFEQKLIIISRSDLSTSKAGFGIQTEIVIETESRTVLKLGSTKYFGE